MFVLCYVGRSRQDGLYTRPVTVMVQERWSDVYVYMLLLVSLHTFVVFRSVGGTSWSSIEYSIISVPCARYVFVFPFAFKFQRYIYVSALVCVVCTSSYYKATFVRI